MSEPPRDWEPGIEALPPSPLPRYEPDHEQHDRGEDEYDRHGYDDAVGGAYPGFDDGQAAEEDVPHAEPLSTPRETSGYDDRFTGNGWDRSQAPYVQLAPEQPGYEQDQAIAPDYSQADRRGSGGGGARTIKLSLWGSPQSGKTTFLAALRHAANAPESVVGTWNIFPMNADSSRVMASFTHELSQGRFPALTLPGQQIQLEWLFVGDITRSPFVRPHQRLLRRGRVESRFVLDLIDVSGEAFAFQPERVPDSIVNQALDRLTEADGIIYLFDPLGERDNRNSGSYVNRVITELRHRAVIDRYAPHRLRQQIAVCVTKFDDPAVFQEARRNGFVTYGKDGVPRVPDEHAEEFFECLCTDRFWRTRYEHSSRSAVFIMKELPNLFGKENIRYYVSSSIGFYEPPGGRWGESGFDPEHFTNVKQVGKGERRIKGSINPINVLEPLISVQQRIEKRGRKA